MLAAAAVVAAVVVVVVDAAAIVAAAAAYHFHRADCSTCHSSSSFDAHCGWSYSYSPTEHYC